MKASSLFTIYIYIYIYILSINTIKIGIQLAELCKIDLINS
jgi:hypothetical protein